jgi:hypothetical protein
VKESNRRFAHRCQQRGHRPPSRRGVDGRWSVVAVAIFALLVTATLAWLPLPEQAGQEEAGYSLGFPPPPQSGYFSTLPPGSWYRLPGDERCSQRVHASTWEPRPDNYVPNHTMPPSDAVRASLTSLPRDRGYAAKWYTWLRPRVTGAHVGTTDENIQWAA